MFVLFFRAPDGRLAAHAQLVTALLGVAVASYRADAGHRDAELALLLGAAGFRADCQTAKIRRDLSGLLYADGIHDSLFLAAGKRHTGTGDDSVIPAPRPASTTA
ncbi:hypothetical protein [Actinokineospora inagensis]|uniref:hypothetical protein n=1 Tax=Actinokineospora inagensis TaxID=103730 RepID=UPI00040EA2D4|nr:hypothetical protein [Actinokineospora inagensis]